MADAASRTFSKQHASGETFHVPDDKFLHMFNLKSPHPQANSWRIFQFSTKLSMLIFSELCGMTSTLAGVVAASAQEWKRYWNHWTQFIKPLRNVINRTRHLSPNKNHPPWSFRSTGPDWREHPRPQQSPSPNGSSRAACHQFDTRTGWKTKPDTPLQRMMLAPTPTKQSKSINEPTRRHRQNWQCQSKL